MENEQMKFNLEEPTSEYYLKLKTLEEFVDDLQESIKDIQKEYSKIRHFVECEIEDYKKLEEKNESDLAVQKAYEMFVKKDEAEPVLDNSLEQECPVDEKVFDKEKSVDDFSILNIIPEQAKKWVGRLTINEMIKAVNDSDGEIYDTDDEYIGDLVDRLKDMAIAKYTNDILEGRVTTIEDDEIRSEVIDYMKSKKMDIPETIEPKEISIDSIINRLDKGEEIELKDSLLAEVFDKIWNSRNNIEVRIHNNKISLR